MAAPDPTRPVSRALSGAPVGKTQRTGSVFAWFLEACRDLPWRRGRDAYRVWISESMLQQTRVEAVIPYFERFLARFPTVADLAAAPIEDVLAVWSGLGYYRRARSLHAAARAIVERHAGRFPDSRAELLELPGVGPYTAGAVASIAFDRPEPVVDGNVARVLARVFELDMPQESAAFRAATWRVAGELIDALDGRSPGTWNEALMELGALVCVPREPRCAECPLRPDCRAFAASRTHELPLPKARPTPIEVELHVALVRLDERVLVTQRPAQGRMASLWELPTIEPSGDGRLADAEWPRGAGDPPAFVVLDEVAACSHSITRHRIRARVFGAQWRGGDPRHPARFATVEEIARLGPTGLTAKVLRATCVRAPAR